ncbi:hypothetical protein GCK32_001633 [Trichostrongylus colubriformis]|uniref:Uncharacterized protein n=1 Tax=Trichostrongylus colubriformis TaxID=6319 RepID=A0AAN8IK42_TRICO
MFLFIICAIFLVNALAAKVPPAPADIECKDTAGVYNLCQTIGSRSCAFSMSKSRGCLIEGRFGKIPDIRTKFSTRFYANFLP